MPDFYLIDKLMINAEINEIKVMLIINKIDLVENKEIKDIIDIYKPTQYPIVTLSCREQMGFEKLHDFIKDNVVTLAGQSGVGKSSIINVLYPEKVWKQGN